MKRTVAAFAAGLLPGLASVASPAVAAPEPASNAALEPDEPDESDGSPADRASVDAATLPPPTAPQVQPPKPPTPEANVERSVEFDGADAPLATDPNASEPEVNVEIDCHAEPKLCEKAEAKRRPWIRRWEAARNIAELGIFGGFWRPSDEHDLYDPVTRPQDPLWELGADVGVRAAFFPLRPLGIEAEFSANPTRVRTITNDFAFVYGARAHVILQVPVTRIVPFMLGGYGLMGVKSNILILGDDIDPAFHYGGGVKMFVTKRLVARAEVRQIVSATEAQQDSGTAHLQVLAGLSLVLGRKKYVAPPRVVPVDPDRDRDGYLNEVDECPDQVGVAPRGCPDMDGDGISDNIDACPTVPGVEPDGCPPKDSDNDRILDSVDQCVLEPEVYNGVDDEDGCPDQLPPELIIFKGELKGIEFDFGKATIRASSRPVLDDAIQTLKKFAGVRVKIVGHTDNVGTPEGNLELSRSRAESVKQYLVDGGVDAGRIETDGMGDTEPVGTNDTDEGRSKNRRIVFDIIANEPIEVRPQSEALDDPNAATVTPDASGSSE